MTSLDTQTTQGKAEQVQPGTEQAQAPLQVGQNPSMGTVPGLPPTALSMQMTSMNEQYQQAQQQAQQQQQGGLQAMGAQMDGSPGYQTGGGLSMEGAPSQDLGKGEFGRSSLTDLAERMAASYGLDFGRGSLVDAEGNFAMTPDQMASANPSMGVDDIAANMNRIGQAINDRRIDSQQNKATAALQTGLGQLQSRGRGSLAALQSGFFQAMAQNYTNPNLLPEQQDFSYWIQKGQLEEEEAALNEDSGAGGGTGAGGAPIVTQPTAGNPTGSSDTGPQGKGDIVTSGPHAGQRPVYTYDPINQTTTVSWEDA